MGKLICVNTRENKMCLLLNYIILFILCLILHSSNCPGPIDICGTMKGIKIAI